jgi:hypothetical protein
MFPFNGPEDAGVRPLSDEDHQQLLNLVQKYGVPSLICALGGDPGLSCKLHMHANSRLASPGCFYSWDPTDTALPTQHGHQPSLLQHC